MAEVILTHTHEVNGTDLHFVIDPITKEVVPGSANLSLAQRAKNSERFTFELASPTIEGHDMSLCDSVMIHFRNISQDQAQTSEGIYKVTDLEFQNGKLTLSWLIGEEATVYAGGLIFSIHFACTNDMGEVVYNFPTLTFSKITVGATVWNSETIAKEYPDIIAQFDARIAHLENSDPDRGQGGGAVYDSVEAMKQNFALTAGNSVRTTGYYEPNDGGGGFYKIYDEKPGGWCEELANGKFAQLQTDGTINVKQAGAKSLGYISDVLNRIISETDIAEIYIPAGRYGFNSTVVLSRNVHIRGAGISDLKYGTYINTDCNEAFTTNDINRRCIFEKLRFQGSVPSAVDPSAPDFTILFSRCNFGGTIMREVCGVAYNIVLNGSFYQCSLMDNCDFQQVKTAVFTTKLMPEGYEHFASASGEIGDAKITNTYFNGSVQDRCYFAYDYYIGTTTITDCFVDFFYAVVANSPTDKAYERKRFPATVIGNTFDFCYKLFDNQDIWGLQFIGNRVMHFSTLTESSANKLQRFLAYLTEEEIASGSTVFDSVTAGGSTISGNNFGTIDHVYKFSEMTKTLRIIDNTYDDYYGLLVDCAVYAPSQDYTHVIDALDYQVVTELPNPRGTNTYCGHKLYYNNALVTNMKGVWRYANGKAIDDGEAELVPTPTAADEGKFLKVVNGVPVWAALDVLDMPKELHAIILGVNNANFWDEFQQNGERTNYEGAFASALWTDEFFTPKYSMNCTAAGNMFRGSKITAIPDNVVLDTTNCDSISLFARDAAFVKLPRIVIGTKCVYANMAFLGCTNLVEIETLAVYGAPYGNGGMMLDATNLFHTCYALEKITIEGEIFFDVNFKWSTRLSVASMQSVITHLKNCAGTDEAMTHTVTFATACWAALDAEGATAPGGVTWRAYVAGLGWNAAEG